MPDTTRYVPPDCAPDCPLKGKESHPDPMKLELIKVLGGAAVLSWERDCKNCPGGTIHTPVFASKDVLIVPIDTSGC